MQMRKVNIWVSLFIVILILVCLRLCWLVTVHSVEEAFVLDYVKRFYEIEEKAIEGEFTPEDAAGYVKFYYPVGTKLKPNTVLSDAVETIRIKVLERINTLGQSNVLGTKGAESDMQEIKRNKEVKRVRPL